MSLTPSNMLPLGTKAPDFTLPEPLTQKNVSLSDIRSDIATVVMFICNHCPYVIHVRDELAQLANDYQPKGISVVAINANDIEHYPDDSPENMAEEAKTHAYPFPYLFDETQEIAKAYQAACTPDFYVFDKDLKCVYRGQLDGSRPSNDVPVTGEDLRGALDSLLAGKPVDEDQSPSSGCNIKWK